MKVIIAIDSFKGCMTSREAGEAAREALLNSGFEAGEINVYPVSDGGEGFLDAVKEYVAGDAIAITASSPSGNSCEAQYYMSKDRYAYIESASVCGYNMVSDSERSALHTSSYGLGQLIADAVKRGARKIIVGLGGSCTCDAGVGMLQALGVNFYGSDGVLLEAGQPALMHEVRSINAESLRGWRCPVELWVDTKACFCGPAGAVWMYGRQKGLNEFMLPKAEEWMNSLKELYGLGEVEGSGAAGGIAGALHALLNASILSGAEQIMRLSSICATLPSADAVFTGEGRLDIQTLTGKLPAVIAGTARKSNTSTKVICICGQTEISDNPLFDEIIRISPEDSPLSSAMETDTAINNLKTAIMRIERL